MNTSNAKKATRPSTIIPKSNISFLSPFDDNDFVTGAPQGSRQPGLPRRPPPFAAAEHDQRMLLQHRYESLNPISARTQLHSHLNRPILRIHVKPPSLPDGLRRAFERAGIRHNLGRKQGDPSRQSGRKTGRLLQRGQCWVNGRKDYTDV
jgi:hypothetical protein